MVISQGDVYWAGLSGAKGSEPGNKRPVVIVQRDSINISSFQTVLVVPLTKQTRHASIPGNILLNKGEANLSRASLARCTHVIAIDKNRLIEKIGTLPSDIIDDIVDSICWVLGRSKRDL